MCSVDLKDSLLADEAFAQEERDKEARKQAKIEELRWERVFAANRDGVRVLHEILTECGVFGNPLGQGGTSFTGNSQSFFLEGKRALGLWIMARLGITGVKKMASVFSLLDEDEQND